MSALLMEVLTWVAAATCLLAAAYVWAGRGHQPDRRPRRAGRVLVCAGHALLGARLTYLILIDDLSRLSLPALVSITLISLGTAAIWADIHEEDRQSPSGGGAKV